MKRKLIGYYDYTVILTYLGMLFAFSGILMVIGEDYWDAVFCLMLAGICDMFDGAVAATKVRTDSEKRFGIQIDSLSDLISFGVCLHNFRQRQGCRADRGVVYLVCADKAGIF